MERRIIHNQHGLRLWPRPTVMKELLDEILKDLTIGRILKHACEKNAILRVRW